MSERPILFSGAMVRAILEGRKTQTRRLVKPQPSEEWLPVVEHYCPTLVSRAGEEYPGDEVFGASDEREGRICPFGSPGDRLWVRETWGYRCTAWTMSDEFDRVQIEYLADLEKVEYQRNHGDCSGLPKQRRQRDGEHNCDYGFYLKSYWRQWRPSIFMPRWASRLTLEVKAVRVERLQEISEADAFAEGISGGDWLGDPVGTYRKLWDSINAKSGHGWNTNPWVWVLEFERVNDGDANGGTR